MTTGLRKCDLWKQDRMRRKAARAMKASPRAEAAYTLAIAGIMRGTHNAVLEVVRREYMSPEQLHHDAKGLGGDLTQRLFAWQRPKVQLAFDVMASHVDKKATESLALVGISPRHVAGVESMIEHARERNVQLVRSASQDFLDQVKEALEQTEGMPADAIAELLEARVGVSRSRANTIARTETLKMNSQIIQHRARSAGVEKWQWSGALDERERPMHRALEGQIFTWDHPPVTNEDGDTNVAGEDYNCRCVPLVIIAELDEPEEAEAEGEQEAGLANAAEEEE